MFMHTQECVKVQKARQQTLKKRFRFFQRALYSREAVSLETTSQENLRKKVIISKKGINGLLPHTIFKEKSLCSNVITKVIPPQFYFKLFEKFFNFELYKLKEIISKSTSFNMALLPSSVSEFETLRINTNTPKQFSHPRIKDFILGILHVRIMYFAQLCKKN